MPKSKNIYFEWRVPQSKIMRLKGNLSLSQSGAIQYGSVKARDAINRRLYKGLIIVKTAIYRVFGI
ncbi:MAG: hypothetical protein V7L20_01790 [Nostoc sp.]|uniref:hypothetical protein n=1 Tax=Nostoc sp. TaxID=1180 RepID=UPI002FFB15EE